LNVIKNITGILAIRKDAVITISSESWKILKFSGFPPVELRKGNKTKEYVESSNKETVVQARVARSRHA
jgi:hypothetical protein